MTMGRKLTDKSDRRRMRQKCRGIFVAGRTMRQKCRGIFYFCGGRDDRHEEVPGAGIIFEHNNNRTIASVKHYLLVKQTNSSR